MAYFGEQVTLEERWEDIRYSISEYSPGFSLGYGGTALDIGCAEGWISEQLNALKFEVTAIDINTEAIFNAQKNSNVEYHKINFIDYLSNTDKKFDLILCNGVIGKSTTNHLDVALDSLFKHTEEMIIIRTKPQHVHKLLEYSYKYGFNYMQARKPMPKQQPAFVFSKRYLQ